MVNCSGFLDTLFRWRKGETLIGWDVTNVTIAGCCQASLLLKDPLVLYPKALLALPLCLLGVQANALKPLSDSDLRQVAAKDGVSVTGELDLTIKIASFVYLDTEALGRSNSRNPAMVKGQYVQSVDALSASAFAGRAKASMMDHGFSAGAADAQLTAWVTTGAYDMNADVVQIAFPNAGLDRKLTPSVHLGAVMAGNSTKSLGSFQLKNYDLQGTTTWSWPH